MTDAMTDCASTPPKYSTAAKALHWVVAALIFVDFSLAISFSRFNPGDALYLRLAYPLHMSLGMAGLMVGIAFVLHRLLGYTQSDTDRSAATRRLARMVQTLLYGLIVVVPVTGWAILSLRSRPTHMFASIDLPPIPALDALPSSIKRLLHQFYFPLHRLLGYIVMAAVSAHAAAALYHHFYRRDRVLRQMLPHFGSQPVHPAQRNSNDHS